MTEFAVIDWTSVLVAGVVGAVLGVMLHLPAVSMFQPWFDRLVFRVRGRGRGWRSNPTLDGIWLSRYQYTSGTRPGVDLVDEHYVVFLERRGRIRGRSLPRQGASDLILELEVEGEFLSGHWHEDTGKRRYHGVCQLQIDPPRDRVEGTWSGFSRNRGIQTDKWVLIRKEQGTGRRAKRRFKGRNDLAWQEPVRGTASASATMK